MSLTGSALGGSLTPGPGADAGHTRERRGHRDCVRGVHCHGRAAAWHPRRDEVARVCYVYICAACSLRMRGARGAARRGAGPGRAHRSRKCPRRTWGGSRAACRGPAALGARPCSTPVGGTACAAHPTTAHNSARAQRHVSESGLECVRGRLFACLLQIARGRPRLLPLLVPADLPALHPLRARQALHQTPDGLRGAPRRRTRLQGPAKPRGCS